MKKRILLDARWIKTNKYDGISQYSQKLFEYLYDLFLDKVDFYFLICNDDTKKLLPSGNSKYFIKTNPPYSPLEVVQALKLRKYDFDLIYSPFCIFGYFFKNCPLIITIHDMTRHKDININWNTIKTGLMDLLRKKIYLKMRLVFEKRISKKSKVITVSKTSLIDIEKYLGVSATIISPGIDERDIVSHPSKKYKNQIIYCGRYEKYKNIDKVVKFISSEKDIKFLIVGSINPEDKLKIIHEANSELKNRVIFLGPINNQDYYQELQRSMALINLSSFEGFGMPIIEAMSQGVPVMCSDIDAFKEVGGGAEIIIKTENDFKAAILLLSNPEKRLAISRQSILNAKKYTWDKKANMLYQYMDSLIR